MGTGASGPPSWPGCITILDSPRPPAACGTTGGVPRSLRVVIIPLLRGAYPEGDSRVRRCGDSPPFVISEAYGVVADSAGPRALERPQ